MSSTKEQTRKRAEAEARQAEYDRLSPAQKLERIASRRGESRRERARIETRRNDGQDHPVTPGIDTALEGVASSLALRETD